MAAPQPHLELLQTLERLGEPGARELAAALGVSQPTLSRMIAAVGPEIIRFGRARATRYARSREIATLGRSQPVYRVDDQGAATPIGLLHFLPRSRFWLERTDSGGTVYEGLPPFIQDLAPQGYLGRGFVRMHTDLPVPPRLSDWSSDHLLIAVARRVDNGPGQLIVGNDAYDAFLSSERRSVDRTEYPELAVNAALEDPGSSAAGERPKFLASHDGLHLIVKFADTRAGEAGRRWADLLVAEALALEVVSESGAASAARARILDVGVQRFLEVERFDRVGEHGRKGTISLEAFDDGLLGVGGSWLQIAARMFASGAISQADLRAIRWLETFGQLIANTDRHRGNLSFFADGIDYGRVSLAPAYDMVPMHYAPREGARLEAIPEFVPDPPNSSNAELWLDAAEHAIRFWTRVGADDRVSRDFRRLANSARDRVARSRGAAAPKLRR